MTTATTHTIYLWPELLRVQTKDERLAYAEEDCRRKRWKRQCQYG